MFLFLERRYNALPDLGCGGGSGEFPSRKVQAGPKSRINEPHGKANSLCHPMSFGVKLGLRLWDPKKLGHLGITAAWLSWAHSWSQAFRTYVHGYTSVLCPSCYLEVGRGKRTMGLHKRTKPSRGYGLRQRCLWSGARWPHCGQTQSFLALSPTPHISPCVPDMCCLSVYIPNTG